MLRLVAVIYGLHTEKEVVWLTGMAKIMALEAETACG